MACVLHGMSLDIKAIHRFIKLFAFDYHLIEYCFDIIHICITFLYVEDYQAKDNHHMLVVPVIILFLRKINGDSLFRSGLSYQLLLKLSCENIKIKLSANIASSCELELCKHQQDRCICDYGVNLRKNYYLCLPITTLANPWGMTMPAINRLGIV